MNKKLVITIVMSFMMFLCWLTVLWAASYMLMYQPEITLSGRVIDPYGTGIVLLYFNWFFLKSFDDDYVFYEQWRDKK